MRSHLKLREKSLLTYFLVSYFGLKTEYELPKLRPISSLPSEGSGPHHTTITMICSSSDGNNKANIGPTEGQARYLLLLNPSFEVSNPTFSPHLQCPSHSPDTS